MANENPQSTWDAFRARHPGHPFLQHAALYPMDVELIDEIKARCPNFFSLEDEAFERDLTAVVSFGFYRGRAIGDLTALPPVEDTASTCSSVPLGGASNESDIETISDVAQYELTEYQESQDRRGFQTCLKQRAYRAWLVLNPTYRRELQTLRERWDHVLAEGDDFPRFSTWLNPAPAGGLPPDLVVSFREFYLRWGLETLETWDWPTPLDPDLNEGWRGNVETFRDGGVVLFVPWYLLRGGHFDVQSLVQGLRVGHVPDHLREWVQNKPARGGKLGDARYAHLIDLYWWHELILSRRYPEACQGNRERLDIAMGELLERDADSVKRLRLELERRLQDVRRAVTHKP